MKTKSLSVPKVLTHKRSGRKFVVVRDPDGTRRQVYLRGEPGSREQDAHYREVLANLLAGKPVVARQDPEPSRFPTCGQLAAAFLLHANSYYRDAAGRLSPSVHNVTVALDHLLDQHRDVPTDRFSITDLSNIRQAMIATGNYCRVTVNTRMALVKMVFKWGVEPKLVPSSTWAELSAFRMLPPGRGGVRDNPPVEAVPWKLVEETLPHLTPTVRAAVLVQWWSGARPAEVLSMTKRQLDMTEETWKFTVARHKGSWRGAERVVAIGPNAQKEITPFLSLDMDAAIFSPRRAWQEYRDQLRASRTTPPTKQTEDRDAKAAGAEPKLDFFDVPAYRRAIWRACEKAKVPHWSPHRLRHAAGTRIAIKDGIEVARATLGHTDSRMTMRYARKADVAIAAAAAARHG